MKVYIVCAGDYSDKHIVAVFDNEIDAEKFSELYDKSNGYEDSYILDYEVNQINVKKCNVVNVYVAYINLENGRLGDIYETKEIFDISKNILIEKEDDYLQVKTTISEEYAKKVLIEQYQIYTQQKLEG